MRHLTYYTLFICVFVLLQSCSNKLTKSRAPLTLTQAWASDNTFRTPESVLYDDASDMLYISNINKMSGSSKDGDGYISKLNPDGRIENLYWVTGLNDPKGMALSNNVLYVADVDEVVAISTQSGGILGRYKADEARFLNDVVADGNGNVYISDSETQRIYQLRNGRVTTFIENTENQKPNGLYLENDNRMMVAYMSNGRISLLDPQSKKFTAFAENVPSADGIVKLSNGNYLISNWNGEVYYINQEGKSWKVLDTKDAKINAADIAYSEKTGHLYVPTFNDNRVVAYKLLF
jgi:sugar lactone lactonase YvrE